MYTLSQGLKYIGGSFLSNYLFSQIIMGDLMSFAPNEWYASKVKRKQHKMSNTLLAEVIILLLLSWANKNLKDVELHVFPYEIKPTILLKIIMLTKDATKIQNIKHIWSQTITTHCRRIKKGSSIKHL